MRSTVWFLSLTFAAALLADDPAWRDKNIADWRPADVRLVLTDSPWVKTVAITALPLRGEGQLRDGGRMGSGLSFGMRSTVGPIKVSIRWESARPVRAAELLAGESRAPDWDGAYYALAIYDVPTIAPGDYQRAARELKQTALLKPAGLKDLKPERVVIDELENGNSRILYLFPRSADIRPSRVEFIAQIGHLSIAQFFEPEKMSCEGKVEL